MRRRVGGLAIAAAIALGVPATADAGLLRDVVRSVPLLTGPNVLTPDCTSAGHVTTCTGPVPRYSCSAVSIYTDSGSGCAITLLSSPTTQVRCGVGAEDYAPQGRRESTTCALDAGTISLICHHVDTYIPASSTSPRTSRYCVLRNGTSYTEIGRCESGPGAPADGGPTCPAVIPVLDRVLAPRGL